MHVVSVISFVFAVVVNILSNTLPIGGLTQAEISAKLPNLFTPANVTFSIWGLIYVLLAGFAVFLLFPGILGPERHQELVRRTGILFTASNLLNALWIFLWHQMLIGAGLVVIIAMLAVAGLLYRVVRAFPVNNFKERLFVQLPFQIYFGWLTVAVIAAAFAYAAHVEWDGFGLPSELWTVALIAAAAAIGFLVLKRERDIPYTAVLVWALLGIVIRRVEEDPILWSVALAAAAGALVLVYSAVMEYHEAQSDELPPQG